MLRNEIPFENEYLQTNATLIKKTRCKSIGSFLAERVGFEPTVRRRITGFQDQLLKPLGHLSNSAHHTTAKRVFQWLFLRNA